jgi:hypothetical protein
VRKGFLITCVVLSFLTVPAHAITISVLPASQTVSPGDTVTLQLFISNLGGQIVGDFDLNIGFDSSLLTFNSYTLGGSLGAIPAQAFDFSLGEIGPGSLNLAEVSTLSGAALDALQSDPFSLASIVFTVVALSPGTSTTVRITNVNALGDANGNALPVAAVESATLIRSGVTTIPEPATYLSFGTGLLLLIALRWWRRSDKYEGTKVPKKVLFPSNPSR